MGATNHSNSHAAESSVSLVSKLERVSGIAATHILQSPEGGSVSSLKMESETVATHYL